MKKLWNQISTFLPHEWVASIARTSEELELEVLNSPGISDFWAQHNVEEDPKLFDNPITKVKNFKQVMLPVLVHGDGGEFQKRDSLNVISFKSMLSSISVAYSQMMLAAVPKKSTVTDNTNSKNDTMMCIWEVLVWSFTALFQGVHPATDHLNRPWPKGSTREKNANKPIHKNLRACVFAISGDLEYFQNQFGLTAHSSHNLCWRCPANRSDVPFEDFKPQALWRKRVYTAEYSRAHPATEHPVMRIPGVVSESFCFDILHINELGVLFHYIGNVFFNCVYNKWLPGNTVAHRCQELWKQILHWYGELKISSDNRIGKFSLESFVSDRKTPRKHYPKLKGIKARESRYLLPVAVQLCRLTHEKKPGDAQIKNILEAGRCLEKMYAVMEAADMHPTLLEQIEFREAVESFLMRYGSLHQEFQRQGIQQWNIVPKFHYASHSPDLFEALNIRYVSTYSGETMVGLICALGHSCLDGTAAHKISKKLCWKYRLGQFLRQRHLVM